MRSALCLALLLLGAPALADVPRLPPPRPPAAMARPHLFTTADLVPAFPWMAIEPASAETFGRDHELSAWDYNWVGSFKQRACSVESKVYRSATMEEAKKTFQDSLGEKGGKDWSARVKLGQQCHATYSESQYDQVLAVSIRVGTTVFVLHTNGLPFQGPEQITRLLGPWIRRSASLS